MGRSGWVQYRITLLAVVVKLCAYASDNRISETSTAVTPSALITNSSRRLVLNCLVGNISSCPGGGRDGGYSNSSKCK